MPASVRITWRPSTGDQQAEIVSKLTRRKCEVAIKPGFGIVVAQKPIETTFDTAVE